MYSQTIRNTNLPLWTAKNTALNLILREARGERDLNYSLVRQKEIILCGILAVGTIGTAILFPIQIIEELLFLIGYSMLKILSIH